MNTNITIPIYQNHIFLKKVNKYFHYRYLSWIKLKETDEFSDTNDTSSDLLANLILGRQKKLVKY